MICALANTKACIAILFELLSLGCSDPRLLEEVGDLGVYESLRIAIVQGGEVNRKVLERNLPFLVKPKAHTELQLLVEFNVDA